MSLSKELKDAISKLPSKEKDKLLNRLIPKNDVLLNQLIFKLLENGETTVERRNDVAEWIEKRSEVMAKIKLNATYHYMLLREVSGKINKHVSYTSDKFGEISLNLMMVKLYLENHGEELRNIGYYSKDKLYKYIVDRMIKVMKLIEKIEEDFHLDFEDDVHFIGEALVDDREFGFHAKDKKFDLTKLKKWRT